MARRRRRRRGSPALRFIFRVALFTAAICGGLLLVQFAVHAFWPTAKPTIVESPTMPDQPEKPAEPPMVDLQKIRPNEVGRIPVVMYHDIQASTNYDPLGLNISRDRFKRHLHMMRDAGWYPITMRQVALGEIEVPAGKTPVVLTFDDGRASQFRLLPNGQIDPNCAVGILEKFAEKYPDFPFRATFYLIGNSVPFEQKESARWKISYLLDRGCEIGNHSWTHRYMDQNRGGWVTQNSLKREVAEAIRRVRAYDARATMDTYCLPGGGYPRNKALWGVLMSGSEGGTEYRNLVVVKAWGGPSHSPFSISYDPMRVDRIGVEPGNFEKQFEALMGAKGVARYVSDGDPDTVTVPRQYEKYVNKAALAGRMLRVYDLEPAATEARREP